MTRMLHAFVLAAACALTCVAPAAADPASSQSLAVQHARIDAGLDHSCAIDSSQALRCWGENEYGQLGLGHKQAIGDNELPSSVGPVDLGPGRSARAVTTGYSTCAILDTGAVKCWGPNGNGQLGLGHTQTIGDDETPAAAGTVDLGAGRTTRALAMGWQHTCALLDDGNVRCWGFGGPQLGYGNNATVGDNESPGSKDPVNLGTGRTARAIAAGAAHTCAILDTGQVRCWGYNGDGQLGLGSFETVGDNEAPAARPVVDLGPGRTATAITAGAGHTCAVLDDGSVRCWGDGTHGILGSGNTEDIGDNETPGSKPTVDIGGSRTARAIVGGGFHTCVVLDNGTVRCWGFNGAFALGLPGKDNIGDDESPGGESPVDLGTGRTASALAAGEYHTCAVLDDGALRCWGYGGGGQLGNGTGDSTGDDETPGSTASVSLGAAMFTRVADLGVSALFEPGDVRAGEQARLRVTVANAGPDAGAPQVAVTLPDGLEVVSASGPGSFDAGTRRWSPGAVASGAAPVLDLTVRAKQAGTLRAEARIVAADAADPQSANDAAGASLAVGDAPVQPDPKPDPKPDDPKPDDPKPVDPKPVDTVAPTFTKAPKLKPAQFRSAHGTAISFELSEAATVTFTVERAAGRKRFKALKGSIARVSKVGPNAFRFKGRLSGKRLAPGRYRFVARARDAAGNVSAVKRVTFVVMR